MWSGVRHKYNNVRTEVDGQKFQSKREAKLYNELKLRKQAGDIIFFLPQVPLRLPGGVRYVVDFLVFEKDGRVRWLDAKGFRTQIYITKKKIVEAEYPIQIEEI